VVIADNTVTGVGVVLVRRLPFDLEDPAERTLKGFDDPVHVYLVELSPDESITSRAWRWATGTGGRKYLPP